MPLPTISERENTPPRLTPREIEVLRLLCEPCSTKQAAARLGIRFKTVVSHRSHIMAKAGVHDPISMFRWGIREGYVPPQFPGNGDLSEEGFSYQCTLCNPRPQRDKARVLVMFRCPKHGLCWHGRIPAPGMGSAGAPGGDLPLREIAHETRSAGRGKAHGPA